MRNLYIGTLLFKNMLTTTCLTASLPILFGISLSAQARGFNKNHPCHNIKVACEAAGFTQGKSGQGRGLWVDCLSKIRAGSPVPGVAILPTEVEACNARIAAKKRRK
ncbi:MAG: hypothetical protein JNM39_12065 [Bdellovibrionaceae bacterium]|nr:hypothetical protein [Pseudobdellovibrionaceae bacterium]